MTDCVSPSTMSGAPHRTTPSMKAGLRRFAPASESARTPPMSAPTPTAEFRYPTPASPSFRSSIAVITRKTCTAPATKVCAVKSATSTRSAGSPRDRPEAGDGLGRDRRRLEPAAGGRLVDSNSEDEKRRHDDEPGSHGEH